MDFYRLLEHRAKQLVSAQYYLLIVGDFNCSMEKIDHCDPDSDPDFDQSPARLWLRQFLAKGEFVDCFRHLHKDATEAFTCWNTKISARETNFGTRIDYIVADSKLVQEGLISCDHLTLMTGSDHCPVVAEFRIDLVPSNCTPSLCPKNWPQFKVGLVEINKNNEQTNERDFFREVPRVP